MNRPYRSWLSVECAGAVVIALLLPGMVAFSSLVLALGPTGVEFQVNTHDGSSKIYSPSIAMNYDGNFVIIWDSLESPGYDSWESVQGRPFAAGGVPVGDQVQINS